ncbi:hypothetical protein YEEN111655_15075 [Yersinia entomophaga]
MTERWRKSPSAVSPPCFTCLNAKSPLNSDINQQKIVSHAFNKLPLRFLPLFVHNQDG